VTIAVSAGAHIMCVATHDRAREPLCVRDHSDPPTLEPTAVVDGQCAACWRTLRDAVGRYRWARADILATPGHTLSGPR
jgi:hypothetical protein